MKKMLLVGLLFLAMLNAAVAKIQVVTTLPDFADVVRHIGGAEVEVVSLAAGFRDPHHLEIKPSDILKLRRADAVVVNGRNLDDWILPLLEKSQNPKIQRGLPGFIDASAGIEPLDIPTGKVDRSQGDIHSGGNPHYTLSPVAMKQVVATLAHRLSELDHGHQELFAQNAKNTQNKLDNKLQEWRRKLGDKPSLPLVVYHNSWSYLFRDFNLTAIGYLEPRPGIAPSPAHLTALIARMKQEKRPGIILREVFKSAATSEYVAQQTGWRVVSVPTLVGATPKAKDYLGLMDTLIAMITD